MPEGRKRSRTFRRVHVRTPGGKTVLHHRKRKPAKAHCFECGKVLHGVARGRPSEIHKLAKTERRPERPFAGMLCGACMRSRMISKARSAHV